MEGQRDLAIAMHSLEKEWTDMLQNVKPSEKYDFLMQCIYRVPQKIRRNNPKAYTPQIVSIGPYHHIAHEFGKEDNNFEAMEEFKLNYLKGFLSRTQISMTEFVVKMKDFEEEIRLCYADTIKYNSDDFLRMILVDACFIIELILRYRTWESWVGVDPLFGKHWMLDDIKADLLLLENQLPFFVLEKLYNLTGMNENFLNITFNYFKNVSLGKVCPGESPKHFTDFLRSSIISSSNLDLENLEEYNEVRHVYSASQLSEAGIKFQANPNEGLLYMTYLDEGKFIMPILNIHDGTEIILRNIMAFEHCHLPARDIINQCLKILDFLIDTERDVKVLMDKKIIVNWMGDTNAVATLIDSLGSDLPMPRFNSHYFSLCNSLNNFYENPYKKYKAIFLHEYFNTPWKIASTIAAAVLLFLTLIQTGCSIFSLFHSKKYFQNIYQY